MNKENVFQINLMMNGRTIASRSAKMTEYNDDVIYSLRLNQLMKDMCRLVEDGLKDSSVNEGQRLIKRGYYR